MRAGNSQRCLTAVLRPPVQSELPVLDPERGAIVPSPDLAADPECSL